MAKGQNAMTSLSRQPTGPLATLSPSLPEDGARAQIEPCQAKMLSYRAVAFSPDLFRHRIGRGGPFLW